jgi:hypothetical protein
MTLRAKKTVTMKHVVMRLLREPLLHFFAVAALMFLFYMAVDDTAELPADVIIISPERIDQLGAQYRAVWNKNPTPDELDVLINEDIREEVYYREALALGLDKNDAIVRRRLQQKMEFLSDSGANLQQPAAGELEVYLASNESKYQHASRLAFEQIYLGSSPDSDSISRLLTVLRSSSLTDLTDLGERSYLPAQLSLSSLQEVNDTFGQGFYEGIENFSPGDWAGPVDSAYGVHLVRIHSSEPVRMPNLEDIGEHVLRDWQSEKANALREQDYATRRENYIIEIRRRNNSELVERD